MTDPLVPRHEKATFEAYGGKVDAALGDPLTTQFQIECECEMRMRAMELAWKIIDSRELMFGSEVQENLTFTLASTIYAKAVGEVPMWHEESDGSV